MFEKVNPSHPDKIADRIAGAIVDVAYGRKENPHIAVEVLIGHDNCFITVESDTLVKSEEIEEIVKRISGPKNCAIVIVDQDQILNNNQKRSVRCGDNGIFKGVPVSEEEKSLTRIVKDLYSKIPYDGKYILDSKGPRLVACQSHVKSKEFEKILPNAVVNPLGDWIGGTAVDSGATNRKLGSDMGRAITGGGLHGKDLSKADVSINIYAHLKAQETLEPVEISCAIGDEFVDGKPYSEIVEIARNYIKEVGGFEKFAEWGLIR